LGRDKRILGRPFGILGRDKRILGNACLMLRAASQM
jgi:hypothetical protein